MSTNNIVKKWENKGLDIFIYDHKDKLTLSKVVVPKEVRGEGLGTGFMNELIRYADNTNKTIELTPSKDFGASSVSGLKKFYKNFGFVENKGRNKDFTISESMFRLPKEQKIANLISREIVVAQKIANRIPKELWHISNHKFRKFSRQYAAQGIFWFAKDKNDLVKNLHGAGVTTRKPIWLYRCKANVKNPAGWDEYDKYGLGQIEDLGFDSIDLDDDFVVLDEKDIKILDVSELL